MCVSENGNFCARENLLLDISTVSLPDAECWMEVTVEVGFFSRSTRSHDLLICCSSGVGYSCCRQRLQHNMPSEIVSFQSMCASKLETLSNGRKGQWWVQVVNLSTEWRRRTADIQRSLSLSTCWQDTQYTTTHRTCCMSQHDSLYTRTCTLRLKHHHCTQLVLCVPPDSIIGHFIHVLPRQSLSLVLMKLKLTQQKQCINKPKHIH